MTAVEHVTTSAAGAWVAGLCVVALALWVVAGDVAPRRSQLCRAAAGLATAAFVVLMLVVIVRFQDVR